MPAAIVGAALLTAALLGACDGPRSALDPAAPEAERIAELFWWMVAGAAVIWLAVVGLTVYALHLERRPHSLRGARLLIVGGGVVFPLVVLSGLLTYALAMLPDFLAPAPEGSLRIVVTGEQWWWRVRYLPPGGEAVDLANEIRLPVGYPVEFQLESHDVIHSFWIPPLGRKVDMIPGRRNLLTLSPTRTGVFQGVCAEYCGTSHAFMSFAVVVHEKEDFDLWLSRQAEPALPPREPLAAEGQELFIASGCGSCHTVRGTGADGVVGPDLTHVGSRRTLGAGRLPNRTEDFRRWIARPDVLKPSVHMPSFAMLPKEELSALAVYLGSLR
ncbi:MAG: cytochrome c oxidase subunit II [Vicinamibacteria bacterium]